MFQLFITLLLINSFPSCEDVIVNSVKSYNIENDITYYELFQYIDCNNDKCIDYYELKTFMIKIEIPWRCRWPDKVIKYFINFGSGDTEAKCISWSNFKNNFRSNK